MSLGVGLIGLRFGPLSSSGGPATLPSITVANNNDGTATVTVADSDSGAVNTVRVIRVDTQWDWNTWLDTGEFRTGDGDIEVALAQGVYWFQVTSTGGGSEASSIPVYQWVSSGADPILMQVVDAVTAKIRGLGLTGIASDKVRDLTAVDVSGLGQLSENLVMVAPLDREGLQGGSPTNADFIEYHILVAAAAPANRSHSRENRARWFLWRERIRQALITDKISLATGIIVKVDYTPMTPYDRDYWNRMGFVSPLVFRFVSKEQRQ